MFQTLQSDESMLKHGTVTVIIDHEPYEITTYRIDGEYSDHRRPDSVDFTCDLAEDISTEISQSMLLRMTEKILLTCMWHWRSAERNYPLYW